MKTKSHKIFRKDVDLTMKRFISLILIGFVTLIYSGVYGGSGNKPVDEQTSEIPSTSTLSSVSAGTIHTIAIKTEGSLYAWGGNNLYQLGDGTNDEKKVPTRICIP